MKYPMASKMSATKPFWDNMPRVQESDCKLTVTRGHTERTF